MSPEQILTFWFGESCRSLEEIEARVERWFSSNPVVDEEIRARFGDLPGRAIGGEFDHWRETPRSTVALLIVLDQFPRNLHRGDARSFVYDAQAVAVAREWIRAAGDSEVAPIEAIFGYLPFEHAESVEVQERSVALLSALADRVEEALRNQFESFTRYAERHRDVIRRFGRFPHRNAVLGRASTPDEVRYLEDGGDTFGG